MLTNCEPPAKEIWGNFEIHLITKPEKQMQLFGCIENIKARNDKHIIRPRATCAYALYGKHRFQPMMTFWSHGSESEVTKKANEVANYLNSRDVPVIRLKIEAMAHNDNVPNAVTENHYFEFHFKVQGLEGTKDWDRLVDLTVPHGVHLFHNPYNKNLVPILTIRSYVSLTDLEERYERLLKALENYCEINEKFSVDLHVEKEYSVLDTDVNLDEDWLFQDNPTNFLTKVKPNMKFNF